MPLFAAAVRLGTAAAWPRCAAPGHGRRRTGDARSWRRVGYRWALAIGLTPPRALPRWCCWRPRRPPPIFAVSAVRGVGFAITVTAGGALTAQLIPHGPARRGPGAGRAGRRRAVPGRAARRRLGRHRWLRPVFVADRCCTLLALVSVPGLPARESAAGRTSACSAACGARTHAARRDLRRLRRGGRRRGHLPPAGADPQRRLGGGGRAAAPAAAATAGRWVAGRLGDRRGQPGCWCPAWCWRSSAWRRWRSRLGTGRCHRWLPAFGAGFGVLQNATLSLMYARVPAERLQRGQRHLERRLRPGHGRRRRRCCAAGHLGRLRPGLHRDGLAMVPALWLARRETTPELDHSTIAEPALSAVPAAA